MKTFIAVLFSAVIVSSLYAQQTQPDAAPQPDAPPNTVRLDPLSPEPLTLMPDAPSTVPKPVGTSSDPTLDSQTSLTEAKASLQKSKAAAEADDLKERIEKTKAEALSRIDLKPPFDSVPAIHRQNG